MITREDVREYFQDCGAEGAYNLLLLAGPDGYDGSADEYFDLLNEMSEARGNEE